METLTTTVNLTTKQQLKIDRFLLKSRCNMPFVLLDFFYKSFKNFNNSDFKKIELDKLYSLDNESLKFLTDFTHKLEFMLPEERILTKGYIQNNYPLPEKERQFSEFMCRLFDYQFRIDELIRVFEFIDSFQEEIFSDPLSDEETKFAMFLCFKGSYKEACKKFENFRELENSLLSKSQENTLRNAYLKYYFVSKNKKLYEYCYNRALIFVLAITLGFLMEGKGNSGNKDYVESMDFLRSHLNPKYK